MKKLLACILALSFCTTVNAGLISSIKNKVKNTTTKVKNKFNKQSSEIDKWLTEVQNLISKVIPNVQTVYGATTMNATILNNSYGLYSLLNVCLADPFKATSSKSEMDEYINKLKKEKITGTNRPKNNKDNKQKLFDEKKKNGYDKKFDALSSSYTKLSKKITEYNNSYIENLNKMKSAAQGIQTAYQSKDANISSNAGSLKNLLDQCDDPTAVSNNLSNIQTYIKELKKKLKLSYIDDLKAGETYLKTHVKYQTRSQKLSSSSDINTTTVFNKTTQVLSATNQLASSANSLMNSDVTTTTGKLNTAINAVSAANTFKTNVSSEATNTSSGNIVIDVANMQTNIQNTSKNVTSTAKTIGNAAQSAMSTAKNN